MGLVNLPATLVATVFLHLTFCGSTSAPNKTGFPGNVMTTMQPIDMNSQTVAVATNVTTFEGEIAVTERLPEEEDYLTKFRQDLFVVVILIITIVGVTGNTLTLITTQREKLRTCSVCVYMAALSCADTLVLLLDFINNWVRNLFGVFIVSSSTGFCTFYQYIFNVCYTYAAWLVVSLACERFIVVHFPLKAKMLCTTKKAIITVCVEAVAILVLYTYGLAAWEINEDGRCDLNGKIDEFMSIYSPWISGVAYSYLPVCLLIFFNAAIIYDLSKTQKNRKTMGVEKLETRKVTITVIVICIAFILLTVPLTLFYVIVFSSGMYVEQTPAMAVGETIILILGLSNHAINFFLYNLTSEKFRLELKKWLCCGGKDDRNVSVNPPNSSNIGSSNNGSSNTGQTSEESISAIESGSAQP